MITMLTRVWDFLDLGSFCAEPERTVVQNLADLGDAIFHPQQGLIFDHVLTPEKVGDVLVGHNGETDRFVFDDPSLSPDLSISAPIRRGEGGSILPTRDMDLEGREPIAYLGGLKLTTPAVQIKNFNPEDGDAFDFSGLSHDVSFSGHTPRSYSVWTGEYNEVANSYPMKVDLDGDPKSIEMGMYIHLTAAERKEEAWDWDNDGEVDMYGYSISPTKTMTDDMFIFA